MLGPPAFRVMLSFGRELQSEEIPALWKFLVDSLTRVGVVESCFQLDQLVWEREAEYC